MTSRSDTAKQTSLKPGINFLVLEHDDWCPCAHGDQDGSHCICNPTGKLVDQQQWMGAVTRTERRRREREARKAQKRGT